MNGSKSITMLDLKKELNEQQYNAVTYFDSPLLILAGAGSGKTRVLTYKIAYIIEELGASPYSVFAVTFTNKAANEMKERVEHLLNISVRGMWIGTFHSMCVKMIKMYRGIHGLNRNFTIYDAQDSKSLVKKLIKDNDEPDINYKICTKTISNLKNSMIDPAEYASSAENPMQEKIARIYSEYEGFLQKNNAYDFDSLLLETVKILKDDTDFKHRMHSLFKYILVDEYQDTNTVQYELLKQLYSSNNHIAVVGDDDQSIYGFRGAQISNILDFDRDFQNTMTVKLEQNYRSTKKILDVASTVIARNEKRKAKTLWSDLKQGNDIELVECMDEKQEAQYIAGKLRELSAVGRNYSQCAILYRTNAQSRPFEEMLRKHSIPYTVIGGVKFFERMEIRDILAYSNITVNTDDSLSLRRIMNVPRRGIGKKGAHIIDNLIKDIGSEMLINEPETYEKDLPGQVYRGIKEISDIIISAVEKQDNAFECINQIIEASGYMDYLERFDSIEALSRKENVQELINSAYEFIQGSEDISLSAYLDMISLYTDTDDMDASDQRVFIMTVHNAKGLEFENVFITGMEEGLFPHINSFDSADGVEEERRLFYVAMTRAKENLYISYANMRNFYGNTTVNGVSMFLKELPVKNIRETFATGHRKAKAQQYNENNEKLVKEKTEINIGQHVVHPMWGDGMIRGLKGSGDNTIAIIDFNTVGVKKVYVKYANLRRK